MNSFNTSMALNELPQDNFSWARPLPIYWSDIESRRGTRDWSEVSLLTEQELRYAAESGKEVILIIISTPDWAQKVPWSFCGPIKSEEFGAFAAFMRDLVTRYSTPPFSVRYWELWNEPDVDPSLSGSADYGCWGDETDPYYGGGYYAELLKVVYPEIKEADPQAQVLVGGLLLNCDPRVPGPCDNATGKNLPPMFLEGVLRNGGGPYFDGISFHAYDIAGSLGTYSSPNWKSSWDTTGPALIAKARFLKEVLAKYGMVGKSLISTEVAVTNYAATCDQNCELTKAYYIPQLYTAAMSEGLLGNLWYAELAGWRNTDLFDGQKKPLPAYTAYSLAWDELHEAQFKQELSLGDHLKGYEFDSGGHKLWVLWAQDQSSHTLPLPGSPLGAVDALGNYVTISNGTINLTLEPVYAEWLP